MIPVCTCLRPKGNGKTDPSNSITRISTKFTNSVINIVWVACWLSMGKATQICHEKCKTDDIYFTRKLQNVPTYIFFMMSAWYMEKQIIIMDNFCIPLFFIRNELTALSRAVSFETCCQWTLLGEQTTRLVTTLHYYLLYRSTFILQRDDQDIVVGRFSLFSHQKCSHSKLVC